MAEQAQPITGRALIDAVAGVAQAGSPVLRRIAGFATTQPDSFVRMSARDICDAVQTSEPTLIRFCRQFGQAGVGEFRIELALAMAEREPGLSFVPLATDRRRLNTEPKTRIAQAALPLVASDATLLIDNGSTAELFARGLRTLPPKVVMTNGLMVAQNALEGGQHRVLLTGGDIAVQSGSLGGRLVEHSLREMHFDTFIMGADSIHPPHGISTHSEAEAHVTRAMLERAARVIVLADHSKFRRPGLHRICGLQRMHTLVTDRALDPLIARAVADLGVQVVVAPQDRRAQ